MTAVISSQLIEEKKYFRKNKIKVKAQKSSDINWYENVTDR